MVSAVEMFSNISIKNFRDLIQCLKEEEYLPGDMIIKEGTKGTKFYFIMKGCIKIYSNNGKYVFIEKD